MYASGVPAPYKNMQNKSSIQTKLQFGGYLSEMDVNLPKGTRYTRDMESTAILTADIIV